MRRPQPSQPPLWERLPLWLRLRCGVEPKTLAALVVVLLIAVAFGVQHFWEGRPRSVAAPGGEGIQAPSVEGGSAAGRPSPGASAIASGGATAGAAGSASGATGKRVVVDVSGKVREPGVHRLPAGSRVEDAIEAAGGARRGTDMRGLNRARLLVDGEQIVVGGDSRAGGGVGAGSSPAPGSTGATGGAGAASGGTVSLSTATVEQLDTLPGIGPVLAQHIIEYRDQHGGFTSIDQLRDVNGIGERRFADLKPRVTP
ncbi:helix-hairpin-helix domain-containing protein [Streptomyces daliensis]